MKLYEFVRGIDVSKYQKNHTKKKKPITEVGTYCPKEKVGQAWCYTKDSAEKGDVEE